MADQNSRIAVTALSPILATDLTSDNEIITFTPDGNTNRVPLSDAIDEYLPTSCGLTLDAAYDSCGAGLGREIIADSGAVKISGEDGLLVTGTFGSGADSEWVGGGSEDAVMFFNPKKSAFRAGLIEGGQWDDANIGDYSFAIGNTSTASGENSVSLGGGSLASGQLSFAMGVDAIASDYNSFAFGESTASAAQSIAIGSANASGNASVSIGLGTTASGDESVALGSGTTASGDASTSMGRATTAESYSETAIGLFNTTYSPASTSAWEATDRLFVIGNGQSSVTRADALIVQKNGNLTMPTTTGAFSPPILTTTERNALTPTAGMMIYNSTDSKHQGYDGTSWNNFY